MTACHHIASSTASWPWIGVRYTDGRRVVCGGCLPRDDSGRVLAVWKRAA